MPGVPLRGFTRPATVSSLYMHWKYKMDPSGMFGAVDEI